MSSLHVHFLPKLVEPEEFLGGTVVVIDVLRATTVIATALAAGARQIIPCGEIEEAQRIASQFAAGETILGGERGGLPIPGFDLGNSPCDYTPERVGGKTIVFTTTNGTQAMLRCRQATRVLTAAFVNVSAIAGAVQKVAQAAGETERIHLLCAGTQGRITREDVLLAGCLVDRISDFCRLADEPPPDVDDQAMVAEAAWRGVASFHSLTMEAKEQVKDLPAVTPNAISLALEKSVGGRNLKRIGLASDIIDAAQVDRWPCVPELELAKWSIHKH